MWHELQEEIEVELEELKRLFEPFESLLEKVKSKAPDTVETVALAGLLSRYSLEHLELQALTSEIAEIRGELELQAPTLNSLVITANNPVYQSLERQQVELEAELESLRARKDNLGHAIELKKKIVDGLPAKEAKDVTVLSRRT